MFPFLKYDTYCGPLLTRSRTLFDILTSYVDRDFYVIAFIQDSHVPVLIYGYNSDGKAQERLNRACKPGLRLFGVCDFHQKFWYFL